MTTSMWIAVLIVGCAGSAMLAALITQEMYIGMVERYMDEADRLKGERK